MVNGMKILNRKGFTLIELLAVIIILAIIMGFGSYVVTGIINKSKEKDYELLVNNIKDATEQHYIECEYNEGDSSLGCDSQYITLGKLVEYGYLKSNSKSKILVDPRNDTSIKDCYVSGIYENDNFSVRNKPGSSTECPVF